MLEDDLVEYIVCGHAAAALLLSANPRLHLVYFPRQSQARPDPFYRRPEYMGTMVSRKLWELTHDDIRRITDTMEVLQNDEGFEDIPGFCKAAT